MSLRRTAMARKSELRRRTPMPTGKAAIARRASKTIGARKRVRDTGPTVTQRRQVANRAGYCCEICGLALHNGDEWIRPHSFHHRLPRGMGGAGPTANSPANILLLCGTGTTGCHGVVEQNRDLAYDAGTLVRRGQEPGDTPVRIWCFPHRVLLTGDGQYLDAA